MEKFLQSIKKLKQNGDAVHIGKIVNQKRITRGDEKISPAYIRSMLNGNRKITSEVKEVADAYYKAQAIAQEQLMESLS